MERETQTHGNYETHDQETSIGNSNYQREGSSRQGRSTSNQSFDGSSNQGSNSSQQFGNPQQGNAQRGGAQQSNRFGEHNQPLSDLAFDWVTLVQKKAKALKAYDQYIQDAEQCNASECAEFFRKVQKTDSEHLIEAKKHLAKVLQGTMGNK